MLSIPSCRQQLPITVVIFLCRQCLPLTVHPIGLQMYGERVNHDHAKQGLCTLPMCNTHHGSMYGYWHERQ